MSKTALLAAGAFAAGKAKEAKKATENADGKFTSLKEATLNKPLVWLIYYRVGWLCFVQARISAKEKVNAI